MTLKKTNQTISEKEVLHLAELARLDLSGKDVTEIRLQLNKILDYFKMIDDVDTEGISPTYHAFDLVNILRDDEPHSPEPKDLLENVPKKKDRYIKAPKMI